MCKLCITTHNREKVYKPLKNPQRHTMFHSIVNDYIGTNSCTVLQSTFYRFIKKLDEEATPLDIDYFILRKINSNMSKKSPVSAKEIKKARVRISHIVNSEKVKECKKKFSKNIIHKKIETNIRMHKTLTTGTVKYTTTIHINKNTYFGTFNSLEEAQQFKQEILNEKHNRTA